MIKYKLICKKCKKSFDSWFSSSKEYEKLKKLKLIDCNYCNSKHITKSLMAPNVVNFSSENLNYQNSDKERLVKVRKKINNYQNFIKNNFKYVGENFAYEARSIHYNKKKKLKGIFGKATKEQIQDLNDEGIETHTIPWIENKDN